MDVLWSKLFRPHISRFSVSVHNPRKSKQTTPKPTSHLSSGLISVDNPSRHVISTLHRYRKINGCSQGFSQCKCRRSSILIFDLLFIYFEVPTNQLPSLEPAFHVLSLIDTSTSLHIWPQYLTSVLLPAVTRLQCMVTISMVYTTKMETTQKYIF